MCIPSLCFVIFADGLCSTNCSFDNEIQTGAAQLYQVGVWMKSGAQKRKRKHNSNNFLLLPSHLTAMYSTLLHSFNYNYLEVVSF